MTGLEPLGIAAAKAVAPKAATAAWKRLHPKDWERRLAKTARKTVQDEHNIRVSAKALRRWLKDPANESLLDAVVVYGADGVSDETRGSLDLALHSSRSWRKAPEQLRAAATATLLAAIAGKIISSLDPSEATEAGTRRTGAKIDALHTDILDRTAAATQAEFDLAVQNLSAPTVAALRELATGSAAVGRLAVAFSDLNADPASLLPLWISSPPGWLDGEAAGWAALGVWAEELLFLDHAADAWAKAVSSGIAEPVYWAARAAWLLFEQTLPEDDQARVERARDIMGAMPVPEHLGEPPFIALVRALLQDPTRRDAADLVGAWTSAVDRDAEVLGRVRIWAVLNNVGSTATWGDAAAAAEQAFAAAPTPRIGLMLARILTGDAVAAPTAERTTRLVRAYELARSIRDQLRLQHAPSLPAVLTGVQIAEALADPRRVLAIASSWPEFNGEALDVKERNALTAPSVILAALDLGAVDRAAALVEDLVAGYERNLCAAYLLEADDSASGEQRRAAWFDVLSSATSTQQRLPAWRGLATSGATDLPGMHAELDAEAPGLAASLDAAAQAARGFHAEAERTLLPFAGSDVHAAQQLARVYHDQGQDKIAARTLNQAGIDFHQPDMQLQAAETLARIGAVPEAKAIFDRLVAEQGTEWAGRAAALRGAGWGALCSDQLERATDLFRAAVRLDPTSENGRWHLVQVLCQRGHASEAWTVIEQAPTPLQPRGVGDARAWLEACLRGGAGRDNFVAAGLDFIERFPDDERFAAAVLTNIAFPATPPRKDELPPPLRERLARALDRFFEQWPQSTAMRRMSVPEDPNELRALLDSQGAHPDEQQLAALNDVSDKIRAGQFPIALLAEALGKPLAQMIVERAAGPLVAATTSFDAQGVESARAAFGKDVVIDTSALHVAADLARTVPSFNDALPSVFRDVSTTEATEIDLTMSLERLAVKSPGTWVPGTPDAPGYFASTSTSEQDRMARSAANLRAFAGHYRSTVAPSATPLFEHGGENVPQSSAWMQTLQLAHDRDIPLWSDEAASRAMARAFGIAAFSTQDLLAALVQAGTIADIEVGVARQYWLQTGVVDQLVTADMLLRTLETDQDVWARTAIARPAQWMNITGALDRWATFTHNLPHHHRPSLGHWTFASVTGVLQVPFIAGASASRHTVARAVALTVLAHADSPETVSQVVGAMREAIDAGKSQVQDPLPLIVQLLRDALLKAIDGKHVAAYVTAVFSACSEHEQATVRMSLLR